MKIKFINENAFGSYKNRTSKEQSITNIKKDTIKIINDDFKGKFMELLKHYYPYDRYNSYVSKYDSFNNIIDADWPRIKGFSEKINTILNNLDGIHKYYHGLRVAFVLTNKNIIHEDAVKISKFPFEVDVKGTDVNLSILVMPKGTNIVFNVNNTNIIWPQKYFAMILKHIKYLPGMKALFKEYNMPIDNMQIKYKFVPIPDIKFAGEDDDIFIHFPEEASNNVQSFKDYINTLHTFLDMFNNKEVVTKCMHRTKCSAELDKMLKTGYNSIKESVFGSYKNKRTEDDKKKMMQQQINSIYKKKEEEFTKQLWEDVVSKISLQRVERGYYFDCGLNYISDLFGHEQDIPIQAEYKKEGRTLNIFVRVLVYAADLTSQEKIKDTFDIGKFHHAEVIEHNTLNLDRMKKRSERYGAALRKTLRKWFDVDETIFIYKYHLVDPDDPFVLFNNDIHYSVIKYYYHYGFNIKFFSKFIDECFEWFHLISDLFMIENTKGITDNSGNNKIVLDQYSKYIKTASLKINMSVENDIKSFGKYKTIFVDKNLSDEIGRVDLDWVPTSLDGYSKKRVQQVHANAKIFTDELLMELVGHTNKEILDYEGYDKSYLPNHIIFNAFEDNSDIGNLDVGYARKPAYMGRYEHV